MRQQEGSALPGQIFGIAGLVIVDRVGQRHQQGRQTGGSQFTDSQRTGAADHQVGPAIGMGHVFDERLYVRLNTGFAITRGGDFTVIFASLVKDFRAQFHRDLRQGFRQQFVQRLGAQAAAHDQQVRLAPLQCFTGDIHEQFSAHRIAGGTQFVRGAKSLRERLAHPRCQWHQQAVSGTGDGVLFMHDHRDAGELGGDTTRAGYIATKTENTHRLQLTNDFARLPHRLEQHERRLEQGQLALATQARDVDQVQRQTGIRHQFVFDATRRTQPVHGVATVLEFACASQGREYVAPGAARHDQNVSAHGLAPRQNRFR